MRGWAFTALVVVLAGTSAAPAQTTPKTAAKVPRAADGKPDLTGVWQAGSTLPGKWDEANGGLGVGGTGRNPGAAAQPSFNDRADREAAPYQPWAAQKVLEAFNRRAIDDPSALCLPLGLPRAGLLGLFPIQIVQTPKRIVILYEYMSSFRVIPLNATHPDDLLPSYMGNSVGHWEGDTLVVDVTGFNDKTWLAGAGTFHSDALHVVERYTRVSQDRINYDVTIEDSKVLTKPWTIRSSMMLRDGTRLEEYVCAENNLDPGQYEKLLKEGVKFTRE
ncbi:MAG TPA: hypothetical protein VLY24_00090 [Bryobacteraceae bacterium]|nr:hypothetical protein [Bryobacteraceae bacterium]